MFDKRFEKVIAAFLTETDESNVAANLFAVVKKKITVLCQYFHCISSQVSRSLSFNFIFENRFFQYSGSTESKYYFSLV